MADAVLILPERLAEPKDGPSVDMQESTILALTRLYEALVQLSYIPPEALMIPPIGGFGSIPEDELRQRGKTETVIDLLRHLPYIDQANQNHHWTVAEGALHINYAQGNLYDQWLEDDLCPCPGHIISLATNADKYGSDWLLDTEKWDIIEFTIMGSTIEWDHETYESTPVQDRWKSYARMPAASFFDLLRYKYETLEFLIVRDPKAFDGTARCYAKDPHTLWEETLFNSDDEDEDGDFEADPSEASESSSTDGEDEDWEILEDVKELEWLRNDVEERPFPGFAELDTRLEVEAVTDPLQGCSRCSLFCNGRTREIKKPDASAWNRPYDITRRQMISELESIYHEHGWPCKKAPQTISSQRVFRHPGDELNLTAFDRQACSEDLRKWMESVHRREHEEMENRRKEEVEQTSRELMVFRHKLQRLLLNKTANPGQAEFEQASNILGEIQCHETPIEWAQVKRSNLHKVLRAILASDFSKGGDDYSVTEQCEGILDSWKVLEASAERA